MTNLELFKEEQKRIQSGNYKLGDSLYTRCQDCSSSISLLKQCTYVFKYGVRIWQCGFCERKIKVKKKENKMVYKIAVDADSIISKAPVDNDRGNMMAQRYAQWKLASLYAIPTNMEIKEESKKITIIYTYDLNTTPKAYAKITYTVNSLGKISVKVSYDGVENISMMPAFGLTMKIPAEYENLTWYGNGPDENYSDRKHGARLGIFSNKVVDNVSPYSKPQECGNKTDVRWFTVSDSTGNGLKISAKSIVEFSALPYTSHELENASHHYDLPNIHNTVLTINKVQMGVGGDDSWGAPTHSEYLIPSDKPLEFEFCIEAFNIV